MVNGSSVNGSSPRDEILKKIKEGHWLFNPTDRDRDIVDGVINAEAAKKWEEALKGVLRPQVRRLLYTPVILDELSKYVASDPRIHYCFLAGGFAADKMGDLDLLGRAGDFSAGKEFVVRSYADVDVILVVPDPCTSEEKEDIIKDVLGKLKLPDDVEPVIRGNLVYNIERNHMKTEEEMLRILIGHRGVYDILARSKLSSEAAAAFIDSTFTEDKHDRDPTRRYVVLYERLPDIQKLLDSVENGPYDGVETQTYRDFSLQVQQSDTLDFKTHCSINVLFDELRRRTNRSPRRLVDYEARVVLPFFRDAAARFPEELESFRQRHPNYVSKFSRFYSPAPVV